MELLYEDNNIILVEQFDCIIIYLLCILYNFESSYKWILKLKYLALSKGYGGKSWFTAYDHFKFLDFTPVNE